MNLIKKVFVMLTYGMTRASLIVMLLLFPTIASSLMLSAEQAGILFLSWIMIACIVMFFLFLIRDNSRRALQVWRPVFGNSFVITQKREKDVNKKKGLHICPRGLFLSEVNNVVGNIRVGETYRTVTHGRMISLINETAAARAGNVTVTVGKLSFRSSVRKYEKALYDDKICSKCESMDCRIKIAAEGNDYSDMESYYGVTIKALK